MKFEEFKLGDICSRIKSGKNIKAQFITESGAFPVYGGNGLRGFTDHSNFKGKCAIIGRQGAFCGNVRYFDGESYMTEHAVVVCTTPEHNIRYLSYYLSLMNLGRLSGQSAQPGLSVKTLSQQIVYMPSKNIQDAVAKILSSLEHKIALNQKINENLEQQAQAIYQDISDSMGPPNGTLSDICEYSKDRIAVAELETSNYYSTENMLPNKSGSVNATSLPTTAQTTKCHKGDTLISNIRPYFKKILFCEDDCGCSTDVLCFTPHVPEYSAYLFNTLYSDKFFDFVMAGAKGTKMPRGDKKQIMTYPISIPNDEILSSFNNVTMPILKMIKNNRAENKRLSELRDTLLPKLMSGEIDCI